jgi:hypothetical protein
MRLLSFALSFGLFASLALGCSDTSTAATTETDAAAAPSTCSPAGKSVACVGVGGCRGAQSCGADGAYGKCDCGLAPLATCGVIGASAACFGPGGCPGAQICAADGSFAPCNCMAVAPAFDAGSVQAITLTVKTPKDDAIWKGKVVISGSATGPVAAVGVSVGGGPFLAATGTPASWKVSYDSTHLPNGTVAVVVAAQGAGQDVRMVVPVIVDNLDPVVGEWRIRPSSYYPYAACKVDFLPSGTLSDTCGAVGNTGATWKRESPDLVSVGGRAVTVSVSANGRTLTLTSTTQYAFGYPFYSNTLTLDLIAQIDPYLPTVKLDAGPESDGGYVPPYNYSDGGYYYPADDAGN